MRPDEMADGEVEDSVDEHGVGPQGAAQRDERHSGQPARRLEDRSDHDQRGAHGRREPQRPRVAGHLLLVEVPEALSVEIFLVNEPRVAVMGGAVRSRAVDVVICDDHRSLTPVARSDTG
jgi:hypothetical protein